MTTEPLKHAATLLSAFKIDPRAPYQHETRCALMDSAGAQCWSSRMYGTRSTRLYCFRDLSVLIVSPQTAVAYDDWAHAKESQK